MKLLRVALCQYNTYWNNSNANFGVIEELSDSVERDLLVLPEMFNTGFVLNPKLLVDPLALHAKKWLESISHKSHIMGSVAVRENQNFHNQLMIYSFGKQVLTYNKVHTFVGEEAVNYRAGNTIKFFELSDWKISVNICYDLRFPAWCRIQNADVLIFCANWPTKRIEHWHALLKARAIENQCYVVGVNRIGTDGNNWEYNGQSVVFDFEGKEILHLSDKECCQMVVLSKESLMSYRTEHPFLTDKDFLDLKNIRLDL